MSQNVLADAQFTVSSILRPFPGFEAVYQGKTLTSPIVFPGTLDDDAGKPGFSPYLLKGLPVPMGAKMALWFPAITGNPEAETEYQYLLHWRMRNVGDFQRRRLAYHNPKESFGAPDTWLAPSSPERFVLPSAVETVIYQQAEPTLGLPGLPAGIGAGTGNLRTETIAVPSDGVEKLPSFGSPFLPPGSAPNFANPFPLPGLNVTPFGAYMQGVLNPAQSNQALYSIFRPYFTVAKGDELIISVFRVPYPAPVPPPPPPPPIQVWDFTTFDKEFSNLYGTNVAGPTHKPFPDLGVYVMAGSNPS